MIQFIDTKELLVIESKDKPNELEKNIGERLEKYIRWLMSFVPSVKNENGKWEKAVDIIDAENYKFITAGSYIVYDDDDRSSQLEKANVDLIFAFKPNNGKWSLTIYCKNRIKTFADTTKKIFEKEQIIDKVKLIVSPAEIK